MRIVHTRQHLCLPYFIKIFLIATWELWKVRNRLVFDGVHATFSRWLRNFKDEATLQAKCLKDNDKALVVMWLDGL